MPTRRQYLSGVGVAIAGVGATHTALGTQDDSPEVTFGEIDEEGEWLVLHNEEDTDIDIEDWYINWEARNEEQDQWDQFAEEYGDTTIEAEDSIKVATGYTAVEDADVEFENDAGRMNNDGSDVYAVYLPDQQTEVANSEGDRHEGDDTEETPTTTEEPSPTETEPEEETPTPGEDDGDDGEEPTETEECPSDGNE